MMHDVAVAIASFSSDGRRVITVSGSEARVWDAGTGTPADEPPKPGEEVVSSIFNPGGRRVIKTTAGKTDSLWIKIRSWVTGALMVEELCQTRLRGNIAVITVADVRAARILSPQRVGESVCAGVATGPRR